MPPRTNVRLQDALLDRVEALANDASTVANLAYSRAIPTVPRDIHDKLNTLADLTNAAADAYFRMCAVPANLTGRNPLESLSIRALEMARATQITAEMIDAAMAESSPMAAWMRAELDKATDIYRHVNVMARVLLTVPVATELSTETLPDPPAVREPEAPTPDAVAAFLAHRPEIATANADSLLALVDPYAVDPVLEEQAEIDSILTAA